MTIDLLSRFASLFQIDKAKLLALHNEGKDLYSAASELTGVPRHDIKVIAHGLMYSTGNPFIKEKQNKPNKEEGEIC